MVSKDLTFNLFGRDVNASASLRRVAATAETTSRDIGRSFGGLPKYAALASAGVIAVSVKMATDFQSQMALLSSAAGEPIARVKAIGEGVQQIAADTGTPLHELAEGAYTVAKSFGKDGAAGQLTILRAAAEGAAAEHVDLATATDALTSVMKGYNVPAKDAVKVQNELIAASGLSKTTMQDFAGSLSSVVPLASALHVSFAEVGGAIATMTQHGESADRATENLSNLLTNLAGQNNVASQAMQQLGINTIDLQKHLGDRGISGTLDIVEKALAKSSKGGMVVVSSFKQSANATAALNSMLKGMSPQARDLSEHFQKGGLSFKEYGKEMKALGGPSFAQANQFKGLYLSSQGFNNALKSGNPNISTAATQMQKMLGGVTGMRTALMLGGTSAEGFSDAVKEISKASGKGGKDVSSWGITSKTASVQFGRLKESLQVIGVAIGSALLPALTKAASSMAGFFKGVSTGVGPARGIAIAIGVVVGALTGLYVIQKVANVVMFAGRAGLMLFRGALLAWSVATKVAAAAQFAFNLILDANPIAVIVLAIVGLIAIIVILVTHWKQVCKFIQTVWGAVCKWFGDTMAAFAAAWAHGWQQITGFVADAWNGMVARFRNGWNQIVGGVKTAWNAVLGAFGHGWQQIVGFFKGVGGWLHDVGKFLIDGLVNGIKGEIGFVTSTVSNIAGGVIGTFKNILGIHSPSTVFHNFGTNIGQGLTNGLLGTTSQVQSASNRLADTIIGMFEKRKGGISAAAEHAALGTLGSGTRTLEAEAAKRASLIKQVAAAQKQLTADLKAQKKASDSSLKDSVMSDGDVTKFASAGDAVNGLRDLVSNTRRFKTDLQALVKKGLDGNTLKQLIGAGVSGGGLTMADQLLANPIDFKQIVALQNQLASSAGSLASFAGQAEYGSTIKSDKSRLATLKGAERVETWKMQHTAAGMINAIAKETHVHIHLTGHYAGTKDDLAKSVTTAIRDAVRRGQLPKNVLTAL